MPSDAAHVVGDELGVQTDVVLEAVGEVWRRESVLFKITFTHCPALTRKINGAPAGSLAWGSRRVIRADKLLALLLLNPVDRIYDSVAGFGGLTALS